MCRYAILESAKFTLELEETDEGISNYQPMASALNWFIVTFTSKEYITRFQKNWVNWGKFCNFSKKKDATVAKRGETNLFCLVNVAFVVFSMFSFSRNQKQTQCNVTYRGLYFPSLLSRHLPMKKIVPLAHAGGNTFSFGGKRFELGKLFWSFKSCVSFCTFNYFFSLDGVNARCFSRPAHFFFLFMFIVLPVKQILTHK